MQHLSVRTSTIRLSLCAHRWDRKREMLPRRQGACRGYAVRCHGQTERRHGERAGRPERCSPACRAHPIPGSHIPSRAPSLAHILISLAVCRAHLESSSARDAWCQILIYWGPSPWPPLTCRPGGIKEEVSRWQIFSRLKACKQEDEKGSPGCLSTRKTPLLLCD